MKLASVATVSLATLAFAGCLGGNGGTAGGETLQQAGSSTLFPIAEAWAEALAPTGLQVVVAGGGSGAGASKLCAKEIDLGDMSRPMKESEIAGCRAKGVEPAEWKVAFDGLTVVVSHENTFVDHLTLAELKKIWQSEGHATTWADVRAGWPDERIEPFGPDPDSGTYEYFNEEILGKTCGDKGDEACAPRSDYSLSPDDNVLVDGVASSEYAIGHFGFSYYDQSRARLRAVPIVPPAGGEPVAPSFATIADGTYKPLSRPLFVYTNGVPEEGTSLHDYLTYVLGDGQAIVRGEGFVELDAKTLAEMRAKL